MKETIAAIATPHGSGGVAIIRISGNDAANTADKIFAGKNKVCESTPYLMQFGRILDAEKNTVDSVMCVYMKSPHSFTGEDTVEIHCHGGILVTGKILELVLSSGARLAQPGEFTKRAFLNGKLDLSQAEAVADLINAETDSAAYGAVNRMEGKLSKQINNIRNALLDVLAQIMVVSDYPEEEIDELKRNAFREIIDENVLRLKVLLAAADIGRFINEGIFCTLVGRPNTGKSSLLNALAGEERAIVTDTEGTTRDAVTQRINIGGIIVNICDTAGIREAEGIEEIGIKKAYEYMDKSDICIVVADSGSFSKKDEEIIKQVIKKKHIIALNKKDVADYNYQSDAPVVKISAKTGEGLEKLKEEIIRLATNGETYSAQKGMISTLRQKEAVSDALESLCNALETIDKGFPADLAAADLESAVASLGEVTGLTVSDEIIDRIFSKFCLGK